MSMQFCHRLLLTIACLALSVWSVSADTLTVRTLFTDMPDDVIPYLSKTNRLDFIDFMDSSMKAEVTNSLGGKSLMTALTDDSLSITLNESCRVDVFLLHTERVIDGQNLVVAVLRTYSMEGNEVDNDVEFYSVGWKKLTETPQLTARDRQRLATVKKSSNILNFIKAKINKH